MGFRVIKDKIELKNQDNSNVLIKIEDICYIEIQGKHLCFYTDASKYVIAGKMSDIEDKLNPNTFVRSHCSYMVNVEKIIQYGKDWVEVKRKKNIKIPISHSRYSELKKKIEYR